MKPVITWCDQGDVITVGDSWLRLETREGEVVRLKGDELDDLLAEIAEWNRMWASGGDIPTNPARTVTIEMGEEFSTISIMQTPALDITTASLQLIHDWFRGGRTVSCRVGDDPAHLVRLGSALQVGGHRMQTDDVRSLGSILLGAVATTSATPSTRLPAEGAPILRQMDDTTYCIIGTNCPQLVFDVVNLARLGLACLTRDEEGVDA